MNVRLKHLSRKSRNEASVDLWGATAFFQSPAGDGVIAVAGRRSWVDALLRAVPRIEIAPFYYDAQVLYERARGNRDLVVADGSLGVHNMAHVERLLDTAEEDCKRALAILEGKRAESVP